MGRYYSGDIEGKFWFGVQNSDDASFFGGEQSEPNTINFYFTEDDKEDVDNGIKKCISELGDYKAKLDEFFEKNNGYNDVILAEYLGLSKHNKVVKREDGSEYVSDNPALDDLLTWYARLHLGEKIQKCLEEKGSCSFEAEL